MLEAEVLGNFDAFSDDDACGMPVSLQIERLRGALEHRAPGRTFTIASSDLYDIGPGPELDAALDAVVACEPSPLVLVDGRVVCTGAVEVGAVLTALSLA